MLKFLYYAQSMILVSNLWVTNPSMFRFLTLNVSFSSLSMHFAIWMSYIGTFYDEWMDTHVGYGTCIGYHFGAHSHLVQRHQVTGIDWRTVLSMQQWPLISKNGCFYHLNDKHQIAGRSWYGQHVSNWFSCCCIWSMLQEGIVKFSGNFPSQCEFQRYVWCFTLQS